MAFRKEIFQKLREKHKNTPKAILDKVADHLEKGVTEETEIDDSVADADGLVTDFATLVQKEGDRRAAEAKKGVDPNDKGDEGGKGAQDPDNPQAGKDDKETPAWAKALIESNKALSDKVTALEQGKTIDKRKQAVEEKLSGVADDKYKERVLKNFGRMTFEKEEDFEEFLTELEGEATEFSQNQSNSGLGSFKKPTSGDSKTTKEASKEEVSSVINDIM